MNAKPFIELPTPLGSEFIDPEDIISIRANDKSIFISTESHKEKLVKLSIGKAQELFNHPFFVKCHRSHIINILKIKERIKLPQSIKLKNGNLVPLSDTYKEKFELVLKDYCKKVYK
jgi:DNA-binding LytR/AlgR family response regulator